VVAVSAVRLLCRNVIRRSVMLGLAAARRLDAAAPALR
jgi:hypothetical protein